MSAKQVDIANKALLEMKSINEAMTKETKNTVSMLLSDVVKDALRENIKNKKDYVIIEGRKASKKLDEDGEEPEEEPSEMPEDGAEEAAAEGEEEVPEDPAEGGAEAPADGEDAEAAEPADGEDADMSQYQVDDNTYDLTGEQDYDKVVKVYKLLNNDDQVVIKKDEDGKVNLKDNETGAEYVIDFGDEDEAAPMEGGEEEPAEMPEEEPAAAPEEGEDEAQLMEGIYEMEMDEKVKGEYADDRDLDLDYEDYVSHKPDFSDIYDYSDEDDEDEGHSNEGDFDYYNDDNFDDDDEFEYVDDSEDEEDPEDDEGFGDLDSPAGLFENKMNRKKMMKESKRGVIFEVDLGYTDNYQKEDPIKGLSMTEPSEGIPGGTEKPWSKLKKKAKPYLDEEESEFDVLANDEPKNPDNYEDTLEEASTSKSKRDKRHTTKTRTVGGKEYNPEVTKVNVDESLKKIKNENKALKSALGEIKSQLKEAYMTNVNLGKITKLFLENSTTQAEKVNIINRFANEAKNAKQSKRLYESIDKQLKASKKMPQITENKSMVAENRINENKIYESNDLKEMKSFMKRMAGLND